MAPAIGVSKGKLTALSATTPRVFRVDNVLSLPPLDGQRWKG